MNSIVKNIMLPSTILLLQAFVICFSSSASSNQFKSTRGVRFYEKDKFYSEFKNYKTFEGFARPWGGKYIDPEFSHAMDYENPLNEPIFKSYQVIVVIDKNQSKDSVDPGGLQTLRVYIREKGLVYFWYTSTGLKGKDTSVGYFRPQLFSYKHWSSRFENGINTMGVFMPNAVFFNGNIAIHAKGTSADYLKLGQPNSSGCVGLEMFRSEELFHIIGRSGYAKVDELNQESGLKTDRIVSSYQTLIIVNP